MLIRDALSSKGIKAHSKGRDTLRATTTTTTTVTPATLHYSHVPLSATQTHPYPTGGTVKVDWYWWMLCCNLCNGSDVSWCLLLSRLVDSGLVQGWRWSGSGLALGWTRPSAIIMVWLGNITFSAPKTPSVFLLTCVVSEHFLPCQNYLDPFLVVSKRRQLQQL